MEKMSEYERRRNEALYSMDHDTIVAFFESCGTEMPQDPELFWLVVCQMICNTKYPPRKVWEQAVAWFYDHGYTEEIELPCIGAIAC